MRQFDLFGAMRIEDMQLSALDRIAFVLDDPPITVTLDAQSQTLLGSAALTSRQLRRMQVITAELVQRGGRGFVHVVRSGLHKEIRRRDLPAAVRWGRLLQLIDGPAAVRQYTRRILFEESRAMGLLVGWKVRPGGSAEGRVRALAAMEKKWALPARQQARCGARLALAYPAARRASPITPEQIDRAVAGALDLDRLYRLLWRVKLAASPPVTVHFRQALARRAAAEGGVPSALAAAGGADAWLSEALIEALCGIFEEGDSLDVRTAVDDTTLTVPPLRAYIYGPHTRPGRARLVRTLAHIRPGEPMPSGVDLRWSGMARGWLWRELAVAQHGPAGLTMPYEAVDFPTELWSAAHLIDGFCYEHLYRDAGIEQEFPRTRWLPPGR